MENLNIINRKYMREAIKRKVPRILTKEEIYAIAADDCNKIKSLGFSGYINEGMCAALDDVGNLSIFDGNFRHCGVKCLVRNEGSYTNVSVIESAEYAIFLLSLYYHFDAVATPETAYNLLWYCLETDLLF